MFGKLKNVATTATSTVSNVTSSVTNSATGLIQKNVNELEGYLPILQKAGMYLTGLDVELGVPPKITTRFDSANAISKEDIDLIITEHSDKTLLVTLLKTLSTLDSSKSSFAIGDLKFSHIEIELTAVPSVRLVFEK